MRACLLTMLLASALAGCDGGPPATVVDAAFPDAAPGPDGDTLDDAGVDADVGDGSVTPDTGTDAAAPTCTGSVADCATVWEANAAERLEDIRVDTSALATFLHDMPKGGDLHNHLTGAVYAETYLEWGRTDGDCIVPSTHRAVFPAMCSSTTRTIPTSGAFYDEIVRAWSMQDFVPGGAESGHDHFFATFGKYGAIAGAHRDDDIADIAARAADENQLYIETMFNIGGNIGDVADSHSSGTLTAAMLPALYDDTLADPTFAAELARDSAIVTSADTSWRADLGCGGAAPPDACGVEVRFVAQVSRTGPNAQIFGQLISAFEMARTNPAIVGANLSSPEDDSSSLNNYDLHMAMLGFLHERYTVTGTSPLQITLHAGELTPEFLPTGSTANTFHIREAVRTAHARRIGHGLDILSETDAEALIDEMAEQHVLVEVCLSSNDQILEVSGEDHPLSVYLERGVPITFATDDQGVSRSSMAGEYTRAVRDQDLGYRQLKRAARESLEHAFLPGASLWASIDDATVVAACLPLAETPSAGCQTFLDGSERAAMQYELERRFWAFERSIDPSR